MRPDTNTFWDSVDGVLVVNLDNRPERWQDMQTLTAGLIPADKLHRLSAVQGATLPGFGERPWFRGRKRDRTWAGRAGCTLSHRAAIEYAKRSGWRTLLILEDDVELTRDLPEVLAALPQALAATDWDVCYLGFTTPVAPWRTLTELPAGHSLCRVSGASTTHAYLLRDSTFDWLLAHLPRPEQVWSWTSRHRAIDRWYYRNLARRFVVTAVSPSIIDQQGGFSDIAQREHVRDNLTAVPAGRSGAAGFAVRGALRWLQYRLAEPRDALRGWIIRHLRGF